MSKIALSGPAGGTATYTVTAPTGAVDRTLTLPDQTATLITDSAGVLNIGAGQVYKDASGNVGIGVTPSSWSLSGGKAIELSGGGLNSFSTTFLQLTQNAYYNGTNWIYKNTAGATLYQQGASSHVWQYAASGTAGNPVTFTTGMNLDSSGNLLVGTTSVNYLGGGFTLSSNSGTTKWLCGPRPAAPNEFVISAASGLGVYLTSTSATAWSSASDERLKDIIEPIVNGVEKVCTLRSVIGTYKNDPEKNRRPFLIAQDLIKVFPEAVDASNPDRLGVQYTEIIPLLTAAIQEQQALIQSLTDRITALEGTQP